MSNLFSASSIWLTSTKLAGAGHHRSARVLKGLNFALFKAVLPPEAKLKGTVSLGHLGLGVVIHPNVSVGEDVHMWHRVTLAVSAPPGHLARILVEDGVTIGAGATVVTRHQQSLTLGRGSVIGANSVVTKDVPPGVVVAGNPARVLHNVGEGSAKAYR